MPHQVSITNGARVTIWLTVEGYHSGRVYFESDPVKPNETCIIKKRTLLWSPCEIKAYAQPGMKDFLCCIGDAEYQSDRLVLEYKDTMLIGRGTGSTDEMKTLKAEKKRKSLRAIVALNNITGIPMMRVSRINNEVEQPGYRFRESRQPARSMASSVATKTETIVKTGLLTKQGAIVKTWHTRFFVLTDINLQYFESSDAWKNGNLPLGQVAFADMILPSGEPVDEVPRLMYAWIGKPHCFCVHTTQRTLVMSAQSRDQLQEWTTDITAAYNKFIENQSLRITLLDKERELDVGKPLHRRRRAVVQPTKNHPEPRDLEGTLDDLLEKLFLDFEAGVARMHLKFLREKYFLLWRASLLSKAKKKKSKSIAGKLFRRKKSTKGVAKLEDSPIKGKAPKRPSVKQKKSKNAK